MRLLAIMVLILIGGCTSREISTQQLSGLSVSGEFLFEGPNTLQGEIGKRIDDIAKDTGLAVDEIKAIYATSAFISFRPDSLQPIVESALLQVVSDELSLVSIATKNPFPAQGEVSLEVNTEQDILPYLQDPSSTLVVDANITKDLDELQASLQIDLIIEH